MYKLEFLTHNHKAIISQIAIGFCVSDKLNTAFKNAVNSQDYLFFIRHTKPAGCILRKQDNAFKTKRDALLTAQALEKYSYAGGCFFIR